MASADLIARSYLHEPLQDRQDRMTPRTDPDLVIALARYHRAMNAERRELAERTMAIVERYFEAYETLDLATYAAFVRPRLLADLDAFVIDRWYGRWPGDREARFLRLTREHTRNVTALAAQREAEDAARRLAPFPDVLRAIREDAA